MVSYLNILQVYSNLAMKILLSIIMVYIGLEPATLKKLIKQLIIFYLTSFSFGGCAFALLYFIKPQNILIKNGVYIGTYPIKVALLGGIVGFIIIQMAFKIVKSRIKKKDMIYTIKIKILEKEQVVDAMLDTGNLLKDPITKEPVIVVEKKKLYSILPEDLLNNIEKIIGGEENTFHNKLEENKYLSRIKIIPFSSLGKQNGLMLGIKADEVTIQQEEAEKKTGVIIGISQQKLSDYYSAIFGLDLLEGSGINELIASSKR